VGSQIETSSVRRTNAARAAGARLGAKGKSAMRVRAKSTILVEQIFWEEDF
jgi:hypothetical protein